MFDGKALEFRSPRNITEEDIDEALRRAAANKDGLNYAMNHSTRMWRKAMESKEVFRAMLMVTTSMQAVSKADIFRDAFALGLQLGFDLHSARGDAGSATAFAPEEQRLEAEEKAEREDFLRRTMPKNFDKEAN